MSALKKQLGDNLAFYAWKITYNTPTCIQIQWLIGVDPSSTHQNSMCLSQIIKNNWLRLLKDEELNVFNINQLRNAEKFGLRVIYKHDPKRIEIMDRYIDAFLLSDYTYKQETPKGMRAFGSSKRRNSHRKTTPLPNQLN